MQIAIVTMGHPNLNINRVMSVINKYQTEKLYEIIHLEGIPNIGNADLDGFIHSDKLLFGLLGNYINQSKLVIGLTTVQLEKDWWIRPNQDRSAMLITTYEADSLCALANRTLEEFVIFKILTCILASEYFRISKKSPRENLIHDDCRQCLFDFCPNKLDRWRALKELTICTQCKGNLQIGNVAARKIAAIEAVMNYMKKPSLKKSAYLISRDPYLSGIIGIGLGISINIIGNYLFTTGNLVISLLLILFCIGGPFLYKYYYDR